MADENKDDLETIEIPCTDEEAAQWTAMAHEQGFKTLEDFILDRLQKEIHEKDN